MPWVFEQATGDMYAPDQTFFAESGSGRRAHLNNPDSQCIANNGPIPRGRWRMTVLHNVGTRDPVTSFWSGRPYTGSNPFLRKNPKIIRLASEPDAAMKLDFESYRCDNNRDGFFIHGGNLLRGDSQGCIILEDEWTRKQIWDSADRILYVVLNKEDAPCWVKMTYTVGDKYRSKEGSKEVYDSIHRK